MMNTVYIYELCDPHTGNPCYIGQSVHPVERLAQHISTGSRGLQDWLLDLRNKGEIPVLKIAAECTPEKADDLEQRQIFKRLSEGYELLNHRGNPKRKKRQQYQPPKETDNDNIPDHEKHAFLMDGLLFCTIPRTFIVLANYDLAAAMFLYKCYFWDKDVNWEFFHKDLAEWKEEAFLNLQQLEYSAKSLADSIDVKLIDGELYFRINQEGFEKRFYSCYPYERNKQK